MIKLFNSFKVIKYLLSILEYLIIIAQRNNILFVFYFLSFMIKKYSSVNKLNGLNN